MAPRTRKPAHERLKAFIDSIEGMTQEKAAEILGVSGASLSDWIRGESRPRGLKRKAIERWTDGAIAEDDWMTHEERSALDAIEPGAATGTDGRR